MSMVFDNRSLSVPVYIDTNALLDLVASMENGFSFVEKVTSQTASTSTINRNISGEFGVANFLSMLKVGFNASRIGSDEDAVKTGSESERYHTYGSLLHRLLSQLDDNGYIKRFDGKDNIEPSDFVEISGEFRQNPLVESLNALDRVIELIGLFAGQLGDVTANRQGTKRGKVTNSPQPNQLRLAQNMLKGLQTDLITEGIRTFVVDVGSSNNYKATISLFKEYLRDQSMTELTNGEFRVFGKVVRNLKSETDRIDLLKGSSLSRFDESILEPIFAAFSELEDSGLKLPTIERYVNAPALQIVPIAIYV